METRTARVRIELPTRTACCARPCTPTSRSRPDAARPCVAVPDERRHRHRRRGRSSSSTRARAASSRARSRSACAATASSRSGKASPKATGWSSSANFLIDAESNLKAAPAGAMADVGGRERPMIARLIGWSARNLVLVLIGTVFAVAAGRLRAAHPAARRHPRPLGRAGHRLHRVPGAGAAGRRGPGHLSADHRDADGAEVEGGARLLVLRRLLRLRDLRGRHRSVLGPQPRARIPERGRRGACRPA